MTQSEKLLSLYPSSTPLCQHSLPVGDGHILKVQEHGTAKGLPAVFLHGGPGAGCSSFQPRFFNPQKYRVVTFDQRGCGGSTPHAELHANTTAHLLDDIERIREHLDIERWLVFGGSWGSALGLAYAQRHPERVLGLIVRGVFLCREQDVAWFYQRGAGRVFPDYWQEFLAPIPPAEHDDLVAAYYARLTGDDELARMAAAKAWSIWEGRTATLRPNPNVVNHFADPYVALSLARIECHYFMHDCFLEPDQLLRDVHRLADVPGVIVQGRYDIVCPMDQAHALHLAWPAADYVVVPDAGHSALEPGIIDALVRSTDNMAAQLQTVS